MAGGTPTGLSHRSGWRLKRCDGAAFPGSGSECHGGGHLDLPGGRSRGGDCGVTLDFIGDPSDQPAVGRLVSPPSTLSATNSSSFLDKPARSFKSRRSVRNSRRRILEPRMARRRSRLTLESLDAGIAAPTRSIPRPPMSELGVKPRFNPAKDELPELSKTYLETRNRQMRSKAQTAEMLLAKAREELVLKISG